MIGTVLAEGIAIKVTADDRYVGAKIWNGACFFDV
jgi:hypothetical protein